MSNTTNKVQPFGMRDKLGYMFGDFGNDFTFPFSVVVLGNFRLFFFLFFRFFFRPSIFPLFTTNF